MFPFAGSATTVIVLAVLVHNHEKRRELRQERPPQTEKLLRPAGYSALLRLEALDDSLMQNLLQAVASGLTFGLMAGACYSILAASIHGTANSYLDWTFSTTVTAALIVLLGLSAPYWCISRTCRVWQIAYEIRCWRFGMRGELAVAEKLAGGGLAAAGYIAFHDVPGDGDWNIDHVVVGPGGVFVLETKTKPRRKATRQQEEHIVFFDGRLLQFPWCYDDKAGDQAERNARWVRDFLSAFPPKNIPVQPVIVLPGWYVENQGNFAVKAMNASYLTNYIKNSKPLFTEEQLESVIQRLDERCRTVEF